ncbi:GNAT family N-acetyltransferase [Cryptosporangium aurantiacum]|uniref:Protein N-acetyltransferase, RimJ/RimL family n=1 Tax=Cryptosporangium aurantiacum TaxID=134849 RepID=A0A1M7R2G3_9ACTN|nr:GNAT family N-acetyltransferase [Cryptosporangium aurantiacum]SHN38740.1 Protein N-acetyltransferase, RimJ/RimL family [Cryptosporangium aurantiacum]
MVLIQPWTETDLDLLRRINTPAMKMHVGGPETESALLVRHGRYLNFPREGKGCMFSIRLRATGDPVGSVGYAERTWQGEAVFEMGWNVLTEFQGRGIAGKAAAAAAAHAAGTGRLRWLHAFPSVDNTASNAVCRRVGFELAGECAFEFPPGRFMRSNDWRLDLPAFASPIE